MSTNQTQGADWPAGVGRIILDEVDSTMAEAARRAASVALPTWILARRQTAGRGRLGNPWSDPQGNLAATLIYRPAITPSEAALRSYVAALALYDALCAYVSADRLSLKWPNDVLLDGGKVAGILLESSGTAAGVNWLAVGIGVNLANVPPGLEDRPFRPVALGPTNGTPVTPEAFLTVLARAFAQWESTMAHQGFAPIRDAWLARAARLGQTIHARTASETVSGTFDGLDGSGNLILLTPRGPRSIAAAEVFF